MPCKVHTNEISRSLPETWLSEKNVLRHNSNKKRRIKREGRIGNIIIMYVIALKLSSAGVQILNHRPFMIAVCKFIPFIIVSTLQFMPSSATLVGNIQLLVIQLCTTGILGRPM